MLTLRFLLLSLVPIFCQISSSLIIESSLPLKARDRLDSPQQPKVRQNFEDGQPPLVKRVSQVDDDHERPETEAEEPNLKKQRVASPQGQEPQDSSWFYPEDRGRDDQTILDVEPSEYADLWLRYMRDGDDTDAASKYNIGNQGLENWEVVGGKSNIVRFGNPKQIDWDRFRDVNLAALGANGQYQTIRDLLNIHIFCVLSPRLVFYNFHLLDAAMMQEDKKFPGDSTTSSTTETRWQKIKPEGMAYLNSTLGTWRNSLQAARYIDDDFSEEQEWRRKNPHWDYMPSPSIDSPADLARPVPVYDRHARAWATAPAQQDYWRSMTRREASDVSDLLEDKQIFAGLAHIIEAYTKDLGPSLSGFNQDLEIGWRWARLAVKTALETEDTGFAPPTEDKVTRSRAELLPMPNEAQPRS
ncbi:MAG: hypothetical protein M1831_004686 [Alyxoria varia]|nr:MAG: hypothetical protein M1831_004686 [Alyxoria varia]